MREDVDALAAVHAEAKRAADVVSVNYEAFSRLYEATFTKFVGYVQRRFKYPCSEVENIVQDEFVRL